MNIDFDKFLKDYRAQNNFMVHNGIVHNIVEPGKIESTMTILEQHLSTPGVSHGGAVAGFMDGVLGVAALTLALTNEKIVSTVEFKMNYFKPIFLGDVLTGKGKVIRNGKTLLVCLAEIYRGDELVAHGQGTFNAYPLSKRAELKDMVSR